MRERKRERVYVSESVRVFERERDIKERERDREREPILLFPRENHCYHLPAIGKGIINIDLHCPNIH